MEKKYIQWTDSFSVESVEIDHQHQKLINLINELYVAYMDKDDSFKPEKIIDELAEYALSHFETEEKYFEEFEFEGAEEHIAAHNDFIDQIKEFQTSYKRNKNILTLQIFSFLQRWLTNHILGMDKKYIECFKENNVL